MNRNCSSVALVVSVLFLVATLGAETYHGFGFSSSGAEKNRVEIIVISSGPTGKVSYRYGGSMFPFKEFDLVVTQIPRGGNSLIGYFREFGSPVVIRVDTWGDEKKFYFYDTKGFPGRVFEGSLEPNNKER